MDTKKIFLLTIIASCLFSDTPSIEEKKICTPLDLPLAVLEPVDPCRKVILSASLLYWQAKVWGLEFAAQSYLGYTPPSGISMFDQTLFVPNFAWKPGFKAHLGYQLPSDGWDLTAGYTYYFEKSGNSKKHFDSQIIPEGFGIIPLWNYPFVEILGGTTSFPIRFSRASGSWNMHFNAIDLEFARSFYPKKWIPLRLNLGAKASIIDQDYDVLYEDSLGTILGDNFLDGNTTTYRFVSSALKIKTEQWGIGPRFGLDSKWHMYRGFNLIGNSAFSMLLSYFSINTEYNSEIQITAPDASMKMKEHFHELTPVAEAMLGINYAKLFNNGLKLDVTLGYEWQYWWQMNHARRNYVQGLPGETFDMRGDLQMQGLNATIKLDF